MVGLFTLLGGCDSGPGDSLYDPNYRGAPAPVISSVTPESPPNVVLAGVDTILISGENFSPDISKNFVYFNAVRAQVIGGTDRQLRVRVPYLPLSDMQIRVSVMGAPDFSNSKPYQLLAPAVRFGGLLAIQDPSALTTDDAGNVYVSMFQGGTSIGIQRYTPEGQSSTYFSTHFSWMDLTFGPDGMLYAVRGVRAVFRLPAGGTQQTWATLPVGAVLNALDFGPDGALWTSSSTGTVYRIAPDNSVLTFAIADEVQDLAIFNGHLYVAATENGASNILRFPIDPSGQLGSRHLLVSISGQFNTSVRRLAFAADGSLLVGTGSAPGMVLVQPNGSAQAFYPGIITAPVRSMAWGAGTHLFALARATAITESRDRSAPDLIRIETRKPGA
jgi:sugar lactone lactonase YvrE